jgi:hypothetical protein
MKVVVLGKGLPAQLAVYELAQRPQVDSIVCSPFESSSPYVGPAVLQETPGVLRVVTGLAILFSGLPSRASYKTVHYASPRSANPGPEVTGFDLRSVQQYLMRAPAIIQHHRQPTLTMNFVEAPSEEGCDAVLDAAPVHQEQRLAFRFRLPVKALFPFNCATFADSAPFSRLTREIEGKEGLPSVLDGDAWHWAEMRQELTGETDLEASYSDACLALVNLLGLKYFQLDPHPEDSAVGYITSEGSEEMFRWWHEEGERWPG